MHRDHELHTRRRGRNLGLLVVLLSFIVLMFGLTIVKVREGGLSQAFDHVARPEMIPIETPADPATDPAAPAVIR